MTGRIHRDAPRRAVSFAAPAPAKKAAIDRVAHGAEKLLADFIRERAGIEGDGQTNGGGGNVEINERRAALSVLSSRLDGAELARALGGKSGRLPKTLRADLDWLQRAERQSAARDGAFDLSWAANGTSTPETLAALAVRRAETAELAARAIAADPSRAYDAGNDNLSAILATGDRDARASILADALLQFRAKKRSSALMDSGEGARDGTVGRVASSGTLSTLEQRLACRDVRDPREFALLRLAVANHPHGSTNGIFQARNAIALLKADRYLGRELTPIYNAIHKNYSANTPKIVEEFFEQKIHPGSSPAAYSTLVEAASSTELDDARRRLAKAGVELSARSLEELSSKIIKYLGEKSSLPRLKRLRGEEALFAHQTLLGLHAAVSTARPSDVTLEKNLFYAGEAVPAVAALIHALRAGDHLGAVDAAGAARTALREAFVKTESGFERQMILRLDRQVELLSAELLGVSVARAQSLDESGLSEWLVSLRSALRGVLAGGLDEVRFKKRTSQVPELKKLAAAVEELLAKGSATPERLRELATQIFRSASEVGETMRGYFRRRELAIHFSEPRIDVELDPEFSDNLIKETALHYLLSLAQAGMTLGLEGEISASRITATRGMRVLSSIGPAVYERVLIAKDLDQLLRLGPTQNDFCVVHALDEKSMVAVGGLLTDTEQAPGGYSHLSVFAKGHGISAIALPQLRQNYAEFLQAVSKGGGLYVDDRAGSFLMMPLSAALDAKLLKREELDALRPGFNKQIKYFDEVGGREALIKAHEVSISDQRPTREIELYVPDLGDRDQRKSTLTLEDLGAMAFARTRHLAGEKGAVLARLRASKALAELGVVVPGGASIPPYRIAGLLREAGVFDRWMKACTSEKFLGDRNYRLKESAALKKLVETELGKLLLDRGRPTAAGRALLKELHASAELSGAKNWIARSSFTAEDRPNKSSAGQFESFANLSTAAARLRGIAGVIASMWKSTPIENNVQLGIDLAQVFPSVLVQSCLKPTASGVAVSRGGKGELAEVSYQAVRGFGGGVEGGKAEEGVVRARGAELSRNYKDAPKSLLTAAQAKQLREAVLAIEREFHEVIEPGKGYAVDVEWAIQDDVLHIVQARVIVDE